VRFAREKPCLVSVLAAAVALLTGCPRPLDFGPGGRIDDPGALLASVDQQEAKVRALIGEGRLFLQSPQGQGEVAMYLAVERPDRLHLESFDFFNRPLASLTTDGQQFGLYDGTEGRYYFGPATAQNLRRFLQTALTPAQVAALMLGSAPRDLNAEATLDVDSGREAYRLVLSSPTQPQRLWIHPLYHRAVRSEWGGGSPLIAEFGDFTRTAAGYFPREIKVTAPRAELTLRLRYTQLNLNSPAEGMFAVEAPEGVPQTELDADGFPVPQPTGTGEAPAGTPVEESPPAP